MRDEDDEDEDEENDEEVDDGGAWAGVAADVLDE